MSFTEFQNEVDMVEVLDEDLQFMKAMGPDHNTSSMKQTLRVTRGMCR